MSLVLRKPTIRICENKGAEQLHSYCEVTAKLIFASVFATRTVQFLYYLNPKFLASSHLLCLHMLVCVGPVRKPHCWFSHEAALTLRFNFSSVSHHLASFMLSSDTREVTLSFKSLFSINRAALSPSTSLIFFFSLAISSSWLQSFRPAV